MSKRQKWKKEKIKAALWLLTFPNVWYNFELAQLEHDRIML